MNPDALPDVLVLDNGWSGGLGMLTLGLLVIALGIYAVRVPEFVQRYDSPRLNRLVSWGIAGFGAVIVAAAAIDLVPGANGLILTREGFTQRTAWRERHERWDQVLAPFTVERRGDPEDWVRDWAWPATVVRYRIPPQAGTAQTCCIESLLGPWGHANEDLAAVLNAWRTRAIAAPSAKQ